MKRLILAAVLSTFALGCSAGFNQPTPKGFVELEEQESYDYRATTADGLVYAVRAFRHKPKGELEFWTRAIENHMRKRVGYALLGTVDVAAKGGLKGKQLRFGHDRGRVPHLYHVSVFVTESRIFVIEAGGTKKQMEAEAPKLAAALAAFEAQ